jgi:membrane protease YdiL (CAAX protease family)
VMLTSPKPLSCRNSLGRLWEPRRDVSTATSHGVSALGELLGLRQVSNFYHSSIFLSCLAVGGALWAVLPFLVTVHPLSWHRILSVTFFLAVVWQPIVEELLFRGCLQGSLSICEWG